jgi:hypothetical protein
MTSATNQKRTLLYDIENTPLMSYNWGIYEQNAIRVVQHWYILSFSWKWADEKQIHALALTDFPSFKKNIRDDKPLVMELHKLMSQADEVIAHNGNRHDQKKSHTRMIFHGLTPPEPYNQIDTLTAARSKFAFSSNRLDDLGDYLGVGRKVRIHPETWEDCMNGDRKAFEKMKKYNKQDVALLERVYLKLRPWMANHPNLAEQDGIDRCPRCGSTKLHSAGFKTQVGGLKYRKYQCQNCGGYTSSHRKEPSPKNRLKAI